jgi:hypothetical protein
VTKKGGVLIVRISPFEGEDSQVQIYDASGDELDELFMVVSMENGEELDSGYRSFAEIADAWPEAVNAKLKRRPGSYMGR